MSSRILFSPIHGTSLLEMLPIAQKLVSDGIFEPVFFIFCDIPERHIKLLYENNIRQIYPKNRKRSVKRAAFGNDTYDLANADIQESVGLRKRLITKLLSWDCFSFIFYFFKYLQFLVYSRRLLASEDIAAVLVVGDRHIGWETALIKEANEQELTTLIIPFALSDPESDALGRLRKEDVNRYRATSFTRRLVRRIFPDWVQESKDGPLFFYPIGEALAAKVLGIMPKYPWSIGGGAAKRMAVESHHVLEVYQKEGITLEKMVVTGKPSFDHIFSQMQAFDESKFRASLGLEMDQRIILCSVPQLAEHGLLSWDVHWQEIEFLFASLSTEPGASLVLSLHPQSDPTAYRELAGKYDAVIANQRIYDLIPICDFLVSTFSSVVVQAIGCGKPAIVVDFYGLKSSYYDSEPGVIVIKDRDDLVPTINRLINDRGYYQQLVDLQLRRSPEWVLLDGGCTRRVVDELYQMIEKKDNVS